MTPPRTAITGGTGFVGRHLAARLGPEASVVISRRTGVDTSDVDALTRAFEGCEVVAHCAGINREIGDQTYQRVHIEGTANVIEAAKRAEVRMLAEGVTDAAPPAASIPNDLLPRRRFTAEQIRNAVPEPGGFGWRDLRVCG